MTTTLACDFCGALLPSSFYEPINTKRGMQVYLCRSCGLIQSISTRAYASRPEASMSCDADRASIKYTKDLVLKPHLEHMAGRVALDGIVALLDVGSNRGAFLNALIRTNPSVRITAIESDPDLIGAYASYPQVTAIASRFEDQAVESATYDLVYCAHTLEHFTSAAGMLRKMLDATVPGGLLFFAVPNVLFLSENTFEESFIDTHTFHFHDGVLRALYEALGLEVVFASAPDAFELVYLLRRRLRPTPAGLGVLRSEVNVETSTRFFAAYRSTMTHNRGKLGEAAARILAAAAGQRMVFWGAGRIFDGLVKVGGIAPANVEMLVDKYLHRYMTSVHDVDVRAPEALHDVPKGTLVVVASREYEEEIVSEATVMGFSNLMTYSQCMED